MNRYILKGLAYSTFIVSLVFTALGFRNISKNIGISNYKGGKIKGRLELTGIVESEGQNTYIKKWNS